MSASPQIPLPTSGYLANCRWIETHLDQFIKQYPDQWIAVDQDKLLAAGKNLSDVTQDAQKVSSSPDIAYEFMASISMLF